MLDLVKTILCRGFKDWPDSGEVKLELYQDVHNKSNFRIFVWKLSTFRVRSSSEGGETFEESDEEMLSEVNWHFSKSEVEFAAESLTNAIEVLYQFAQMREINSFNSTTMGDPPDQG